MWGVVRGGWQMGGSARRLVCVSVAAEWVAGNMMSMLPNDESLADELYFGFTVMERLRLEMFFLVTLPLVTLPLAKLSVRLVPSRSSIRH